MSTTIEDKISLFSSMIYEKINKEKEIQLKEIETNKQNEIEQKIEEINSLREEFTEELNDKSRKIKNEILSKEKLIMKKAILKTKEEIINDFKKEIKNKLIDFVNSKEYKDYLLKRVDLVLNECTEEGEYNIYVTKNDMSQYGQEIVNLTKKFNGRNFNILETSENIIGGVYLVSINGHFKINDTLSEKLNESKEFIGIKIVQALE